MRVGLEVIKCVVRGYDWTGSSYHKCEYDNNEATLVALYTLFVGDNDLNNTQVTSQYFQFEFKSQIMVLPSWSSSLQFLPFISCVLLKSIILK